jgi:GWxTD domain-containing protein
MNLLRTFIKLKNCNLFNLVLLLFLESTGAYSASIDSTQISNIIDKADILFFQRKIDSAKILYSSILEQNPESVKALLGMAKVEFTQDEFEDKVNNSSNLMEMSQQSRNFHAENNYSKYNIALEYLKNIKNIGSDDIEVDYFMGIVQSEMIILHISADRNGSYLIAKKCFENIIKMESSYQDVLLQYALLLCVHGEYQDGINMMKQYIKLKPSTKGYLFLNRIANLIYNEEGYVNAIKYYSGKDDIDIYSLAVIKRRHKDYKESVNSLQNLIEQNNSELPLIVICRELIKCYAAENDKSLFIGAYNKMMELIQNEIDCDIVFDDMKYLAFKDELKNYYSSDYDYKRLKWFAAFWGRRSTAGIEKHERIYEHYKRLAYAEQRYYRTRARFGFLKPMESYNCNEEYSDQGYIYIKYGEPDKVNKVKDYFEHEDGEGGYNENYATSSDPLDQNIRESWLYSPSVYNDKKIFHFFGLSKTLVSMIYDDIYMKTIRDWDPRYSKIQASKKFLLGGVGEADIVLKNELGDSLKSELITNIQQERSEINITYKQIKLNYEAYKFRGKHNKTELLIAYFLPIPTIFKEIPGKVNKTSVLEGYSFYDNDWNLIVENQDSITYEKKTDGLRPKVKFISFEAVAGKVNSSMYCNPIGTGVSCFNKDTIKVPGYPKTSLCASDIMISAVDTKAKGNGKKWNNYYLLPSPTNKWSLKRPINIYYEIYNLKKNQDGKTLFRLEYAFRFKGSNENVISQIFSKENNEVVSTEYSKSGKEAISNEFISFDLSRLSPGYYILEITVKDINTNKEIILKREVELFKDYITEK